MQNKTILYEKIRESLLSVIPIAGIVFLLCFTIVPVPNSILMAFVLGTVMLILGMGFFTLGTDLAMTPIGEYVGAAVTKHRKLWFIILLCFLMGSIITISEPDLQVLAEQVQQVPNWILIGSVAVGVGLFLSLAMLRILLKVKLSVLLIFFYLIVFGVTCFVPADYLAVAFDSGGVTTGPMTVPFIMALGVGISAVRSDSDAENDSFGLVALCSIGPILAVLLLGILYTPGNSSYEPVTIPQLNDSRELWQMFYQSIPRFSFKVAKALTPIIVFFLLFQMFKLKLHRSILIKIGIGLIYTYLGLVLFLTGANVGFMPVGNYIGQLLGGLSEAWIIVPIGILIGYFIVAAEPAVHVLTKQVTEITSGAIPPKAMKVSLSIGVAASVGLAMLRIVTGIPAIYLFVAGYLIAGVLTFFSPSIFTAIAFDSGGVASGPMTATFLLPFAMGACNALGGNVVRDAFGVVAMVAMTPLITIQVLGLYYKRKAKAVEQTTNTYKEEEITIIELLEREFAEDIEVTESIFDIAEVTKSVKKIVQIENIIETIDVDTPPSEGLEALIVVDEVPPSEALEALNKSGAAEAPPSEGTEPSNKIGVAEALPSQAMDVLNKVVVNVIASDEKEVE